MKSPFPGMDPYLESHWRDVHPTLIIHARAMLNRQLGSDLRARVDERLVVESPWDETRRIHPDVHIVEHGLHGTPVTQLAGVAIAEPLVLELPQEIARERYIEIIDPTADGKIITVIEFLSPSNKLPGDGRAKYLRKQEEVIEAGINLVEVDLTRTGRREVACPPESLPASVKTTYLACVYRGSISRRFEIYALPLRDRLPAIRIPLRPRDPDAVLDLQALVDTAYEEGRHDDIDYSSTPVPALSDEEASWVNELLLRTGKR